MIGGVGRKDFRITHTATLTGGKARLHIKQNRFDTRFLRDFRNHSICEDILALNGFGGMDEFFEQTKPARGFKKLAPKYGLHFGTIRTVWLKAVRVERHRYARFESTTFKFMVKNLYD